MLGLKCSVVLLHLSSLLQQEATVPDHTANITWIEIVTIVRRIDRVEVSLTVALAQDRHNNSSNNQSEVENDHLLHTATDITIKEETLMNDRIITVGASDEKLLNRLHFVFQQQHGSEIKNIFST